MKCLESDNFLAFVLLLKTVFTFAPKKKKYLVAESIVYFVYTRNAIDHHVSFRLHPGHRS